MAVMTSIKKVGFLKWESIVETPTCIYYFYGWTKGGAERQAQGLVEQENKT